VKPYRSDRRLAILQRKPKTCTCGAYAFPHRLDSGKCGKLERCAHGIARDLATCAECEYLVRLWMCTDGGYRGGR